MPRSQRTRAHVPDEPRPLVPIVAAAVAPSLRTLIRSGTVVPTAADTWATSPEVSFTELAFGRAGLHRECASMPSVGLGDAAAVGPRARRPGARVLHADDVALAGAGICSSYRLATRRRSRTRPFGIIPVMFRIPGSGRVLCTRVQDRPPRTADEGARCQPGVSAEPFGRGPASGASRATRRMGCSVLRG